MTKPLVTEIDWRSKLDYNPETGELIWKSGHRKGRPAGYRNQKGYMQLCLGISGRNCTYSVHVIVMFMHGKYIEGMEIDHIDQDRSNNRIENLRHVTRSVNLLNTRGRGGLSKYAGAYKKKNGKWRSLILSSSASSTTQNLLYLGTFDTEEEAARAYDRKKLEIIKSHGYDPKEFPEAFNFPEEVLK